MKKVLIRLVIVLILISLTGCINQYAGKRPMDYGPAIWVSEDPNIWFKTSEITDDGYTDPIGQLTFSGHMYNFGATFNSGSDVRFYDTDEPLKTYFYGYCQFGPNKLVLKVDLKHDDIFNGQVKEITFIRTEIID